MQESNIGSRLSLVLTLMVVVVSCQPVDQRAADPPHDRTAEEAAIREQIAANEAAYNNRDAAGVAATYAPDGDHIAFSSPRNEGREAIRGLLEERWSSDFSRVSVVIDTIRFLRPDVATAEITARFKNGSRPRGTLVMTRTDDIWLITAGRFFPAEQ